VYLPPARRLPLGPIRHKVVLWGHNPQVSMREVAHNGGAPTLDKATTAGAVAPEALEVGGEDDQMRDE
jgi:hypothetical protein